MSKSLSQIPAKTMRPTKVRASVGSRMSGSSARPMRSIDSAEAPVAQAASAAESSASLNPFIDPSLPYRRLGTAPGSASLNSAPYSSTLPRLVAYRLALALRGEALQLGEGRVRRQFVGRRQEPRRQLDLPPEVTGGAMVGVARPLVG